jgi:uncharacterized membrane protein (DUF106 family)
MSKSQNYIIVLGGTFFIIGVIIFGIFQYFYMSPDDVGKQTLDFFKYVIPAVIGTAIVIVKVLNLVEKKELKEKTEQSNDYAKEIKELQSENHKQLLRIEESIATNEHNENKRNAELLKRFEAQLKKEEQHIDDHDKINKKIGSLEKKLDDHILAHKVSQV